MNRNGMPEVAQGLVDDPASLTLVSFYDSGGSSSAGDIEDKMKQELHLEITVDDDALK